MSSQPDKIPFNPQEPGPADGSAQEAPLWGSASTEPWPHSPDDGRQIPSPTGEPALFAAWEQPDILPPTRVPHFGHLMVFIAVLLFVGGTCMFLVTRTALHFGLFGVTTLTGATKDIHYMLGSEAVLYLTTFGASLLLFPLIWHKGFLAGIQWNLGTALRLRTRLALAAVFCFVFAIVNGLLVKEPVNAPIDQIVKVHGAAWLLFAFGVTLAPFFEEITFRGLLLPACCTAWDWSIERMTGRPPRPLSADGYPQWSVAAMVVGSIFTSVPFALMHAEQIANAAGPLLLLVCVSCVLCVVRLLTRSVAACVLVHASYNFLLFSLMLLGTSGFRHMENL
jgi:uncharacterized protein